MDALTRGMKLKVITNLQNTLFKIYKLLQLLKSRQKDFPQLMHSTSIKSPQIFSILIVGTAPDTDYARDGISLV